MSDAENLFQYVPTFNGENFDSWKVKMCRFFKLVGYWSIVSGEETRDSKTVKEQEKFDKKDEKAQFYLVLKLESSVLPHIMDAKSANEMWSSLLAVFEPRDTQQYLLRIFENIKMENGEPMSTYISRVKRQAQKLKDIGAPVGEKDIALILVEGLGGDYGDYGSLAEKLSRKVSRQRFDMHYIISQLLHGELEKMSTDVKVGEYFHYTAAY